MQLQGRLTTESEFENIILKTTDSGGLIKLKNVGRVSLGGEAYGVDAMDLKAHLLLVLLFISCQVVTPFKCLTA